MTKTIHTAMRALLALILLFFSVCSICGGVAFGAPASAATPVLEDLQRDENFNIDDYPEKLEDYSLQVIQIAESTNDELFVYVYQPSGQGAGIFASSINIARQKNNTLNLSYSNYKLEYLNSDGVFFKYKVLGFGLEKSEFRYYNISNIYRPFSEFYGDKQPDNGNKISEVENRVGQLWMAYTVDDGEVYYEMTGSEVIEITQKYVGYVALYGGAKQGAYYTYRTDTHKNFVAFSTDRPIDRLIEAEVTYMVQPVTYDWCANALCPKHSYDTTYNEKYGDKKEVTKPLDADNVSSNSHYSWLGNSYTWHDIQTTEEFLRDNNNSDVKLVLKSEAIKNLSDTQWVLNYHNTELDGKIAAYIWDGHGEIEGEIVSNVSILRLMFETDGVTYNLGVVDNKQTGSSSPINQHITPELGFFDFLFKGFNISGFFAKLLSAIVTIVLIVAVLCLLFPTICVGILKTIGKILISPFKSMGKSIKKKRERKQKQREKEERQQQKQFKRWERQRRRAGRKAIAGGKSK